MHYSSTINTLIVSSLSASERKTIIEWIAQQMCLNTSLSVRPHGSCFVMQLPVPTALLNQLLPERHVTQVIGQTGDPKHEVSFFCKHNAVSGMGDVRGVGWLRRIIHAFLTEISRRIVANANSDINTTTTTASLDFCVKKNRSKQDKREGNISSTSSFPLHVPCTVDIREALLVFLRVKWGDDFLVRQIAADLLRSILHHRNWDIETQLFSALLSCNKYDEMDVKLFVEWWAKLRLCFNPGHVGERNIPSKKIWNLAKLCLSACNLPLTTRDLVTRRVHNVLLRWVDSSNTNGSQLRIPDTSGHPCLFYLPYSVTVLQWYVGAPTTTSHLGNLSVQLFTEQMVPDAHVLALLLLCTKMERLYPSTRKSVPEIADKKASPMTTETSASNILLPSVFEANDSDVDDDDVPELYVDVCGTQGDVDAGELSVIAEQKYCKGNEEHMVQVVETIVDEDPSNVSHFTHEACFLEEIKNLEQRIAKVTEQHQQLVANEE